ncbi:uncharacterized protein DUF4376 [Oceanimonas baumannii]|nr:uncharacterized protein DUF4376 [Oceanimonas baumannii]
MTMTKFARVDPTNTEPHPILCLLSGQIEESADILPCEPEVDTDWWYHPSTDEFSPPPELVPELSEVIENKIYYINVWRDMQEKTNLLFEHAGHTWDAGERSKSRMEETLALADATGTLPEGFFWTTADNIDVPMTTTQLQALASAMAAARGQRGFDIHARQRQMKAEVAALTAVADVQAYLVGWAKE